MNDATAVTFHVDDPGFDTPVRIMIEDTDELIRDVDIYARDFLARYLILDKDVFTLLESRPADPDDYVGYEEYDRGVWV